MAADFAGAGITLHQCGPGMHVPIIERVIRYIQEGVRGTLAGLKYNCPNAVFKHLVPFVADRLNLFPTSTRTDNLSAFQLLHQRSPNAKIDINLEVGGYYQVTNKNGNNTTLPRTDGAIGIGQIPNGTGTCTFSLTEKCSPRTTSRTYRCQKKSLLPSMPWHRQYHDLRN